MPWQFYVLILAGLPVMPMCVWSVFRRRFTDLWAWLAVMWAAGSAGNLAAGGYSAAAYAFAPIYAAAAAGSLRAWFAFRRSEREHQEHMARLDQLPHGPGLIGTITPPPQTCHCLCWKTHPGQRGICTAAADVAATIDGLTVPLCRPCATRREQGRP